MNKAILSARNPQFSERLQVMGYQTITTQIIPCEMPYERDHADLQCLILDDTAFVLSCCQKLIASLGDWYQVVECGERFGGGYPDNVCLNAVFLGDTLICRAASLDQKVREYCDRHSVRVINVRQGYAGCSCAKVSNRAIITADVGISRALADSDIDVLTIGEGSILLDGAEYGFIGGASGYDAHRRTLYFCGDISRHPEYDRIKDFCDKHGTQIKALSDGPMTDIGGILFC